MTDKQRIQALYDYRNDCKYADSYTVSRANYNFLIDKYVQALNLKRENASLKAEIKLLNEMLV